MHVSEKGAVRGLYQNPGIAGVLAAHNKPKPKMMSVLTLTDYVASAAATEPVPHA